MRWFSSSTDEIHSPPDLMTSFTRSARTRYPSGDGVPASRVGGHPSWILLRVRAGQYSSRRRVMARETVDLTVPTLTPRTSAISRSDMSS